MMRWRSIVLLLVIVALVGTAVWFGWSKHLQNAAYQREAGYQSTLRSYQAVLKPGMTRMEVEGYLQSKGVQLSRFCCSDEQLIHSYIIKVGQEPAPWYCSRQNIYLEFQFTSGAIDSEMASRLDTLKKITITPWLEDCL
jgi:hypothetical protein